MSAQPREEFEGKLDQPGLLAVLTERVGNMKEGLDEFRAEIRSDYAALRDEMRRSFEKHEARISKLENDAASARGGLTVGKWLWGAIVSVAGLAGTLVGMVIK